MEHEALEPEQFWDELEAIVSRPCESEDSIDDALRAYLSLTAEHKGDNLPSSAPDDAGPPTSVFIRDYVRRQIIYGLLQEDDPNILHMIASFLLFDGRQNEAALQMMNEEGVFARLLELIQTLRRDETEDSAGLHRLLMDLLYEMSRIQRVKIEDLVLVDDNFIRCLFDIIEDLSYDVTDPYHYPVIRVLLVLNEQFMISAHDPVDGPSPNKLTNKVIKVLTMYGGLYKTFGENIILLINREAETSLQLLTLKLLYLIFTTPSTYEYFFTNDLHVLVDILIRNLLDLPEEAAALRHTYLRVLYPLLAHTQLKNPPHYKREELRKLLNLLVRGQISYGNESEREKMLHFEEVDETTRRLVSRCATVDWLRDIESPSTPDTPTLEVPTTIDTVLEETAERDSPVEFGEPLDATAPLSRSSTIPDSPSAVSPTRMDSLDSRASSEAPEARRKLSAVAHLGMNLEPATSSSLSVHAVAAQHEKPGIITPSRRDGHIVPELTAQPPSTRPPKVKPEPPKARRWRGRRLTAEDGDQSTIPEGIEVSSVSATHTPTTISPSANLPRDRRDSNPTTTAHLVPPVPALRRSASNPPPALPPPRRSSQNTPSSSHHRPMPPASPTPSLPTSGKHGVKPLPPKTRRWGRGKAQHAATDSVESKGSNGSSGTQNEADIVAETVLPEIQPPSAAHDSILVDPFSPTSPTSPTLLAPGEHDHDDGNGNGGPVSVEEALKNVSMH
ncbi:hypothetical protein N7468_005040 [Penicillium chermesinum]|uniref:SPIN90/Ldb17 leucine-rich domain-containing protein n=1 Tax=Penicillium chermesinum TaxID=63820 RepID=A0A9W9NYF3_9EURO|nr:uncharacterized protein N7468_005040 [Penicillium chermesinum]KAJ5232084.1 hypothetical protein N7468_005040 [Penicillium chermesinum]KAJ6171749.1 hypothetical protein N7470_000816 [Penicillium chermesinum]